VHVENETARSVDAPAAVEQAVDGEAWTGTLLSEERPVVGAGQILLVEDEALVRRVTAEVLASAGYRLLIARNAAEAVQVCCRGLVPVDLLLTDVVLPGKNGRELAGECRALYPGIRVLLISGYAEQLALSETSGEGHEYLAKPFSTYALLRKVREVLDGSSRGLDRRGL